MFIFSKLKKIEDGLQGQIQLCDPLVFQWSLYDLEKSLIKVQIKKINEVTFQMFGLYRFHKEFLVQSILNFDDI